MKVCSSIADLGPTFDYKYFNLVYIFKSCLLSQNTKYTSPRAGIHKWDKCSSSPAKVLQMRFRCRDQLISPSSLGQYAGATATGRTQFKGAAAECSDTMAAWWVMYGFNMLMWHTLDFFFRSGVLITQSVSLILFFRIFYLHTKTLMWVNVHSLASTAASARHNFLLI